MQTFCDALNVSPWRGTISEVGLGLEFSADYLLTPGASRTIIGVDCDYAGLDRPPTMRAVSLEYVQYMATRNLERSKCILEESEPTDHLFGFAVSSAHYSDKESHGWMCLMTDEWTAYMHFALSINPDRHVAARYTAQMIEWFLDGCLLQTTTWADKIQELDLENNNVDVLYGPGLGDFERLLLLKPNNPLVYHRGAFHRVVDYLRENDIIYPGAFWPPTTKHIAQDALFEISRRHYYKGDVPAEELIHRMRMLDLAGRPTLLTVAPRFVDKYRVIYGRTNKPVTFLLGADAWNATIIHHQYPSTRWLADQMPHAIFDIMPRVGEDIDQNQVSATLIQRTERGYQYEHYNSTEVRESDDPGSHPYVTETIGTYITNHGLFKTNSPSLASTA